MVTTVYTNATAALALSWLPAKMSECRLCDCSSILYIFVYDGLICGVLHMSRPSHMRQCE